MTDFPLTLPRLDGKPPIMVGVAKLRRIHGFIESGIYDDAKIARAVDMPRHLVWRVRQAMGWIKPQWDDRPSQNVPTVDIELAYGGRRYEDMPADQIEPPAPMRVSGNPYLSGLGAQSSAVMAMEDVQAFDRAMFRRRGG